MRPLLHCANVPGVIAALIEGGMSDLHKLQTVYSTRDAYDMLEMMQVTGFNRHGNSD